MNKLVFIALMAFALVLSGCFGPPMVGPGTVGPGTVNPGTVGPATDWCPIGQTWSGMSSGGSGSMLIQGIELKNGMQMCHVKYQATDSSGAIEMHYWFTNTEPKTIISETYQNGQLVNTYTTTS